MGIKTYLLENFSQEKAPENSRWPFLGSKSVKSRFENPRRGRQARNFTTNNPKILDLKSSSEQIFSRKLPSGAPARSQSPNEINTHKEHLVQTDNDLL